MKIAHLSDPHVNLKFHPQHLPRLRRTLEDALGRQGVEHVVISGDLTSNADTRDLRAVRKLFDSLGILNPSRLTLTIGNHDIFGGPHLAEEVLSFPDKCRRTDYEEKVSIFQDAFSEVFSGTITEPGSPYPFLKRLRNVCLMGLNTVARYSTLENPVGSNGSIPKSERNLVLQLAEHHAWASATHRIIVMHHHLFRSKDIAHLPVAEGVNGTGIVSLLEAGTLKLHNKRKVLRLFEELSVDLILHGHVHFTGSYERKGIPCFNSAGSVFPISPSFGYNYGLVELTRGRREANVVALPDRPEIRTPLARVTETSRTTNTGVMQIV